MHDWLPVKIVRITVVFARVGLWMWMVTLPFSGGLEISSPEWFSTIWYWMWSFFPLLSHFPGDPKSPAGLSELVRYHTLSCPSPQKHQWPYWICFGYSDFSVSRHVCSLPGFLYSISLNIDMNMVRPLKPHGSVIPRMFEFLSWLGSLCDLKICANGIALVCRWYHICPWTWTTPTNSESLVAHVWFGKAFLFPLHNTESENTRTSVLNCCPSGCSTRDKWLQDSLPQSCRDEIPKNLKALFFEVFKSGSHSFNNCLCFGNLLINRNSLAFFTFFTQVKRRPTCNRSWTFASMTGKFSNFLFYFVNFEHMFRMMWSFMSYLHHWVVENQSMDLLEVSALVSILPRVSPCCGCCLQHLHACGVSKMNLAKSGLHLCCLVNRLMTSGFSKLCCLKIVFVATVSFHYLWSIVSFQ